jgi:hypothetical protein
VVLTKFISNLFLNIAYLFIIKIKMQIQLPKFQHLMQIIIIVSQIIQVKTILKNYKLTTKINS